MRHNNYVSSGLANVSFPMDLVRLNLDEEAGLRRILCNLEINCTELLLLGFWVLWILIHMAFIITCASTREQA